MGKGHRAWASVYSGHMSSFFVFFFQRERLTEYESK